MRVETQPDMLANVIVQTQDGRVHTLLHGDIVGRLWTARLQLSDPRISEAHAMISLRGGQLKLLALRGLFALSGKPRQEVVLEAGQRIAFARGLEIRVLEVSLPGEVMGLIGDDLPAQPLSGACFLILRPNPALVSRPQGNPVAAFWSTGDGWRVRPTGGEEQSLTTDWTLDVGGQRYRALTISLSRASQPKTQGIGAVSAPLHLELHWDTVHIHRDSLPPLTLRGRPARLISELAGAETGLPWEDLAQGLWDDQANRDRLRRRFDTVLCRLRGKLRGDGIRTDLVGFDGSGNLSLQLQPTDTVDDRG